MRKPHLGARGSVLAWLTAVTAACVAFWSARRSKAATEGRSCADLSHNWTVTVTRAEQQARRLNECNLQHAKKALARHGFAVLAGAPLFGDELVQEARDTAHSSLSEFQHLASSTGVPLPFPWNYEESGEFDERFMFAEGQSYTPGRLDLLNITGQPFDGLLWRGQHDLMHLCSSAFNLQKPCAHTSTGVLWGFPGFWHHPNWHRDGTAVDGGPMVHVAMAVEDYPEDAGFVAFQPQSHTPPLRHTDDGDPPGASEPEPVEPILKRGHMVVWLGTTKHAGMPNFSPRARGLVYSVYSTTGSKDANHAQQRPSLVAAQRAGVGAFGAEEQAAWWHDHGVSSVAPTEGWRKEAATLCEHRAPIVAPSTIPHAGSGIFASHRLEEGEVVAFYDGYPRPDELPPGVRFVDIFSYEISTAGGGPRVGYREPKFACGVAQLANDAAALVVSHPTTWDDALRAVHAYRHTTERKVTIVPDTRLGPPTPGSAMMFVATRAIAKGEELFNSYGEQYWLHRATMVATHPMVALLIWMLSCHLGEAELLEAMGDDPSVPPQPMYSHERRRVELRSPMQTRQMEEEEARAFLEHQVGVRATAPLWPSFGGAGASSLSRLQAMVEHLADGGATLAYEYEPGDPGYEAQ